MTLADPNVGTRVGIKIVYQDLEFGGKSGYSNTPMNSPDASPRVWITPEDIARARVEHPVQWGPLGERVFYRTYSRPTDAGNEDWHEMCARVVNGNCSFVDPVHIEPDEAKKLYEALLTHQIVPGGRHLWATGVQTGNTAINNCHGADFTARFSEHFEHMFLRLMEGGGVGSNVSDMFINSKGPNGSKWTIKNPHELHIVCSESHADIDSFLQLDNSKDAEFMGYDYTGEVATKGIPFRDLLSTSVSYSSAPIVDSNRVYISVEDSREGWAEALSQVLDLYVSGGPSKKIIVDVSRIRPYKSPIRTFGGTASGPGAFMLLLSRIACLFNTAKDVTWHDIALIEHWIALAVVSGGTRRSARMLMKYWKDPGILEFIKMKSMLSCGNIPHHTTNISVVLDNKFFRAIRRKDEWALKVLDAIVDRLLNNGEPGIVNASNQLIGEMGDTTFYVTNPSLRGDTRVLTDKGAFQIRDLAEKYPYSRVFTLEGDWSQGYFRKTGEQVPLYKITLTNGNTAYATKEHKWPVWDGKTWQKKLTPDIEPGDKFALPTVIRAIDNVESSLTFEDGFVLGWLYGDGWLTYHTTQNRWQVGFVFGKEDVESGVADRVLSYCNALAKRPSTLRQDHNSECWTFCTSSPEVVDRLMGVMNAADKRLGIPETVWQGTHDYVSGFLTGLFEADGHIGTLTKYPSQTKMLLTSSKEKLVSDVQNLLALYGIDSSIRQSSTTLKEKEYVRWDVTLRVHTLVPHQTDESPLFRFSNAKKATRLRDLMKAFASPKTTTLGRPRATIQGMVTVKDVVLSELCEDVYDGTVAEETHTFLTSKGVTGNCGEITMVRYGDMHCFDVCCIGHLNLAMVRDANETGRLLARFLMRASMAKVVDERMKANVDRNHRLGAGILGYADWLLLNRVRYSEAPKNANVRNFLTNLRDHITQTANEYAHSMRVVAPVKTTTIAPTGTISNLSGVTSGMQPVYAQYYYRRVRYANGADEQTLKTLKFQGYNVYEDPYSPNTSVVDFLTEHVLHKRAIEHFWAQDPSMSDMEVEDLVDSYFEDEGTLDFTDVFANQEMLQNCWANNAISVTANLRVPNRSNTEEFEKYRSRVKDAVLMFGERLKGLTMFPEVSMPAAPLERLSMEEFYGLRAGGYPVDVSQDEQKCVNGVCPIK